MTRTSINHDTRADKVLPNTASVTIFIHGDVCTGVTKTPLPPACSHERYALFALLNKAITRNG